METLFKQSSIPEGNFPMRERRTSHIPKLVEECFRKTRHTVLQGLRRIVLIICHVPDSSDGCLIDILASMSRLDSISVNREVRWKSNVLFDKKTVAETMRGSDSNVLRSDFGSCGDPDMADTEPGTGYACVVDGTVCVAVPDDEDVFSGESL